MTIVVISRQRVKQWEKMTCLPDLDATSDIVLRVDVRFSSWLACSRRTNAFLDSLGSEASHKLAAVLPRSLACRHCSSKYLVWKDKSNRHWNKLFKYLPSLLFFLKKHCWHYWNVAMVSISDLNFPVSEVICWKWLQFLACSALNKNVEWVICWAINCCSVNPK